MIQIEETLPVIEEGPGLQTTTSYPDSHDNWLNIFQWLPT